MPPGGMIWWPTLCAMPASNHWRRPQTPRGEIFGPSFGLSRISCLSPTNVNQWRRSHESFPSVGGEPRVVGCSCFRSTLPARLLRRFPPAPCAGVDGGPRVRQNWCHLVLNVGSGFRGGRGGETVGAVKCKRKLSAQQPQQLQQRSNTQARRGKQVCFKFHYTGYRKNGDICSFVYATGRAITWWYVPDVIPRMAVALTAPVGAAGA